MKEIDNFPGLIYLIIAKINEKYLNVSNKRK